MRSVRFLAIPLHVVGILLPGCGGPTAPSSSPTSAAPDVTLRACRGEAWLSVPPRPTEESLYGAAAGPDRDESLVRAKRYVAESIEVSISGTIDDTTRLADRATSRTDKQHSEQTEIASVTKQTVDQRLRECRTRDVCRDAVGAVHSLVECSRRSELERGILRAAAEIAPEAPHDGPILSVPGIESPNRITALAEYVRAGITDRIPSGGEGAQILSTSPWVTKSLEALAKERHARYVLRVVSQRAGAERYRFSVYIEDPVTKERLGAASTFEANLEPWQLALVSQTGVLEPEAGAACTSRVVSGVKNADMREGEESELVYSLCEESYVYVYDVLENGRIALLFPNSFSGTKPVPAGAKHAFPDEASRRAGLRLVACPLPGKSATHETYRVILSPTALDLPGTATVASNLKESAVGHDQGSLLELTQKLDALVARGAPITQQEFPFVIHSVAGSKSGCPK